MPRLFGEAEMFAGEGAGGGDDGVGGADDASPEPADSPAARTGGPKSSGLATTNSAACWAATLACAEDVLRRAASWPS